MEEESLALQEMASIVGKIKRSDINALRNKDSDFVSKCIRACYIMIELGYSKKVNAKTTINEFVDIFATWKVRERMKKFDTSDVMNGKKLLIAR